MVIVFTKRFRTRENGKIMCTGISVTVVPEYHFPEGKQFSSVQQENSNTGKTIIPKVME
jgi:hypothetical protein